MTVLKMGIALGVAVAGVGLSPAATAAVFTDRAAFLAANPGLVFRTFDRIEGPGLRLSSRCSDGVQGNCASVYDGMLTVASHDAARKCHNAIQDARSTQFDFCLYDYEQEQVDRDIDHPIWPIRTLSVEADHNVFGIVLNAPGRSAFDYATDLESGSMAGGWDVFVGFSGTESFRGSISMEGPFKAVGYYALAPAVPEPASWAMMIAGFGLAGTAMRARRTTRTATA